MPERGDKFSIEIDVPLPQRERSSKYPFADLDLDHAPCPPSAMKPAAVLTNAWFEGLFDTLAWDLMARVLFVVSYGAILQGALAGLWETWSNRAADGAPWLDFMTRSLAIINLSVPILLVIVRGRPVARLHGASQRVIVLAGTFLPFAFIAAPSHVGGSALTTVSAALLIIGGGLTAWTWRHLGRSFSLMAEARKLSTTGPYRFVRHPLYLFEEMSVVGVYLLNVSTFNTVLLTVQMACQLLRMRYEERVLEQAFPEYRNVMMSRARIIPGVY
jgi:protein-S-isoprenylcysteine O-methyltransferase Ste14